MYGRFVWQVTHFLSRVQFTPTPSRYSAAFAGENARATGSSALVAAGLGTGVGSAATRDVSSRRVGLIGSAPGREDWRGVGRGGSPDPDAQPEGGDRQGNRFGGEEEQGPPGRPGPGVRVLAEQRPADVRVGAREDDRGQDAHDQQQRGPGPPGPRPQRQQG